MAALFAASGAQAQDVALALVRDGQPASVIVTADAPTAVARESAEELQHHLEVMSGAKVPIVGESAVGPETGRTLILVGQSNRLAALGIDTAELPEQGMVVRRVGNTLVLAGDDGGTEHPEIPYFPFTLTLDRVDGKWQRREVPFEDRPANDAGLDAGWYHRTAGFFSDDFRAGTLNAVYDFLHDELGCRWVWPGPTGEVIPRRQTVVVGSLDVQEAPRMFLRYFKPGVRDITRNRGWTHFPRYMEHIEPLFEPLMNDEQRWLRRMRLGGIKPESEHALVGWYDQYFEKYPEIFAMQPDGSRGLGRPGYPKEFVKMCVSNEKVVDLLIEQFLERRRKNPELRWLNATENDGGLGFCVCPKCRALDVKLDDATREQLRLRSVDGDDVDQLYGTDGQGLPRALTNRYFDFYNRLARRLAEVAPDAYVVTFAYSRYRYAPVNMKVEPNILIGLIAFNYYPASAEQRQAEFDNFLAWKAAGAEHIYFRPNMFFFSPPNGVPWDAPPDMPNDLQRLIANGIVGTDFDTLNGHWSTAAPMYYVMARLQWDGDADPAALRREFMETFGPAADDVEAYFDYWRDLVNGAYSRPDIEEINKQADPVGGRLGRRKAIGLLLSDADFGRGAELLAKARQAAQASDDPGLMQRLGILETGLAHGRALVQGARFAIDRQFDKPTRYEAFWPTAVRVHQLREQLGQQRAHNLFWLDVFEMRMHDMDGVRVYYDFAGRPYAPVVEPPEADWRFLPDPDDEGMKEQWHRQTLVEDEAMHRRPYDHLFFTTWNALPQVRAWLETHERDRVVNGWYQIDMTIDGSDMGPGRVLYVPYIVGSAKIWVDDQLVREVSAEDGKSQTAIAIPLEDLDVRPGVPFRLTIRVHSPEEPGGMIGPVYVARRVDDATAAGL